MSQGPALKHSTLHLPTQKDHLRKSAEEAESVDENTRSVVPSPVEDEDEESVEPSLRVGLVVHRTSAGFASRANNLHSYLELNRFVSPSSPDLLGRNVCVKLTCISKVPRSNALYSPVRPRKPFPYRPQSSDHCGLHDRAFNACRGAGEYQALGNRKTLRHRQDGQNYWMCDT